MRVCDRCGTKMVHADLIGESYSMDMDKDIDVFGIRYVSGVEEVKTIFGKTKEQVNYDYSTLKSALCPKCGKVELYIDINEKEITT